MTRPESDETISLDVDRPVWDRFFTAAPLVVVGTREDDGYDLAPKHMATPLGWSNYFGFVCTEAHATYRNAIREEAFSVSFPDPAAAVPSSLTAAPRGDGEDAPPDLSALPTRPTEVIDGIVLAGAYAWLECELDRVVDGFGENSLVAGRVVAARVRRDALRIADGDDQALLRRSPVLAYLAPGRYAAIREAHPFPFPAGFRR